MSATTAPPTASGTTTDRIRTETVNGEEYYVVPVTAQAEGIYEYPDPSGGTTREYVDGDELTAPLDAWAGVPVSLRHPVVNAGGDLAHGLTRNPGAQYTEVGEFRAVDRSTDTTLRGEAWIPTAERGAHGGDLDAYLSDLEAGGVGEVSTGYGTQAVEPTSGRYNGEPYDAEQVGIQPDHVALLPDGTGNCPVSGGVCGAGRLNRRGGSPVRANAARVTPARTEVSQDMSTQSSDDEAQSDSDADRSTEDIDLDPADLTRLQRAWSTIADLMPGLRTNQGVGDAVRWESEAGGEREPADWRYGVVVDGLQDDVDDVVLVAVYQPNEDYDGWENRGEENRMQTGTLEVVGPDGVASLPPIASVTNADVGANADGEPAPEAEPDDPAGDTQSGEVSADGSAAPADDGQDQGDAQAQATETTPAESGADSPTSTTASDSNSMTDRTETLVEEHGFKPENLPDEDEDCFDRIYDAFAGGDDGGGDAGGEAASTDPETETETADAPETPDGAEATADADANTATVNLGDHDSFEDLLDAEFEKRFNEHEETRERTKQARDIVNSDAPFDEDDLEGMNNEAVARIHAEFVDDTEGDEAAAESAAVNMQGYPGEVSRANTDDIEVSPGNYEQWRSDGGGD